MWHTYTTNRKTLQISHSLWETFPAGRAPPLIGYKSTGVSCLPYSEHQRHFTNMEKIVSIGRILAHPDFRLTYLFFLWTGIGWNLHIQNPLSHVIKCVKGLFVLLLILPFPSQTCVYKNTTHNRQVTCGPQCPADGHSSKTCRFLYVNTNHLSICGILLPPWAFAVITIIYCMLSAGHLWRLVKVI